MALENVMLWHTAAKYLTLKKLSSVNSESLKCSGMFLTKCNVGKLYNAIQPFSNVCAFLRTPVIKNETQ